jgi:hypothetical protein
MSIVCVSDLCFGYGLKVLKAHRTSSAPLLGQPSRRKRMGSDKTRSGERESVTRVFFFLLRVRLVVVVSVFVCVCVLRRGAEHTRQQQQQQHKRNTRGRETPRQKERDVRAQTRSPHRRAPFATRKRVFGYVCRSSFAARGCFCTRKACARHCDLPSARRPLRPGVLGWSAPAVGFPTRTPPYIYIPFLEPRPTIPVPGAPKDETCFTSTACANKLPFDVLTVVPRRLCGNSNGSHSKHGNLQNRKIGFLTKTGPSTSCFLSHGPTRPVPRAPRSLREEHIVGDNARCWNVGNRIARQPRCPACQRVADDSCCTNGPWGSVWRERRGGPKTDTQKTGPTRVGFGDFAHRRAFMRPTKEKHRFLPFWHRNSALVPRKTRFSVGPFFARSAPPKTGQARTDPHGPTQKRKHKHTCPRVPVGCLERKSTPPDPLKRTATRVHPALVDNTGARIDPVS